VIAEATSERGESPEEGDKHRERIVGSDRAIVAGIAREIKIKVIFFNFRQARNVAVLLELP